MIDVKALAQKAGFDIYESSDVVLCRARSLEAFAALVLEAAALECEKRRHAGDSGAVLAAIAIRAMKPGKQA